MRRAKYVLTFIIICAMIVICYMAVDKNYSQDSPVDELVDNTLHAIESTSEPDKPLVSGQTKAPTIPPLKTIKPKVSNAPVQNVETNEPAAPASTDYKAPVKTAAPRTAAPSIKATKTPVKTATVAPVKTKTPSKTSAPVIPTIYTPKASGNVVYRSDDSDAILDVSNTSKGYVAAKYTGNNGKVKVQIKANATVYNYDLPKGSYVYYPLQMGNGTYSISILENISGNQYMSILQKSVSVSIADSDTVYLYPNQFVWFTQNSKVVKLSASVCNGKTKMIDKISAIFKYVTSNISYDYDKASSVKSGYLPDVDEILSKKKGICFDYAAVFAAMCRAQGIPTKLVTGYASPNGVYHAWNQVYTPEKGWITASLYLSKKGYNLVDTTFYSNMGNESSAAKYIGNGSNYQQYKVY